MNNLAKNTTSPKQHLTAELFIATGCAHCPTVMNELGDLLKSGKLGSLNISNIAIDNESAAALNIRSVPWFSLTNTHSSMILAGNYSPDEIKKWIEAAQSPEGMAEYIETFLGNGELMAVTQAIQLHPETFISVIHMLEDEETSMNIRIGLDALVENLSATETLKIHTSALKKLASQDNIRLQIDALHYLALTANSEIKNFIQEKTQDKDKQIQDAAIEALETLEDLISG